MYHPIQLASFVLMQVERGLEGLSEEDAQKRLLKADGSYTNSISWIVGHVCWQWTRLASRAAIAISEGTPDEDPLPELRERVRQFRNGSTDPTPPTLATALGLLHDTVTASRWIIGAPDSLLSSIAFGNDIRDGQARNLQETLGTSVIRNTLHAWYHIGEMNMIRQVLGHAEIPFITLMTGNMEWQPDASAQPDWVSYPAVEVRP